MIQYIAFCTECPNWWEPRKAPEEIDQPRCSECGATGASIRFEPSSDVKEALPRSTEEPELVRKAKRDRRWHELRQRLSEFIDRLEQTGPSYDDEPVAREVRGPYREANTLFSGINDRGPEFSLEELQGVNDRIDELEAEIEDVAPELDIVDDLSSRIEELETQIEELEAEEEQVSSHVLEKKREYDTYSRLLEDIEEKAEAFEQGAGLGFENARDIFQITIPCVDCGKIMFMEPGSQMHRAATRALQAQGWSHTDCSEGGLVPMGDPIAKNTLSNAGISGRLPV